jgi:TMEM175 potassium channel family protein
MARASSTTRLETFSDGVFAVAITLLVLGLHVGRGPGDLATRLGREWPHYVTYAISFMTIGIIWMNHHLQFERIERADRTLMLLNLVLLMFVTAIPFPTSILGDRLWTPSDPHVATAVYAATLLAMGIAFFATYMWAIYAKLFGEWVTRAQVKYIVARNAAGLIVYVAAIAVAFVSPTASVLLCFAAAVYYAFPGRTIA